MKYVLLIIIVLQVQFSHSQIKKFGKVSLSDLSETQNDTFKEANAVVLFKDRKTYYEYDNEYGMISFDVIHERIKIYNKKGYSYSTKKIKLHTNNNAEESILIKAATYVNSNGKIVKTKLKKSEIFSTKINKYTIEKKFTMPNVSDGCIVEWEYKIRSPFIYDINDFVFQNDIPIEYYYGKLILPEQLSLNYKYTGDFDLNFLNDNGLELTINNVKPLKEEILINNIENYRGKVTFEISKTNFLVFDGFSSSTYKSKNISKNWDDVSNSLYKEDRFGLELKKTNYFKEDINHLLKDEFTKEQKINAVLDFVKSKVKWNEYYGIFTRDGVKKAYKKGVGNVAEVNLILVAMLRKAGLDASPILVSTRTHGIPIFPTRKGFNYVIAGVELPNKILLLDATEKYSGINMLPRRVLNWKGRIIRKSGSSAFIDLFPKVYSLETNRASVKVENDGSINGNLRLGFKNLKALEHRKSLSSLSKEQLIEQLEEMLSPIEIEKVQLVNKYKISKPFVISMPFTADNQTEIIQDKIYFTPLFFLGTKENKFKSEGRKLPIDFASAWMTSDEVQIQIPDGYKVETLPESISINTENGIGNYEFSISTKDHKIFLKSVTKINMPIIPPNMYKEIKDFYSKCILKMNEKVVLVKKKY